METRTNNYPVVENTFEGIVERLNIMVDINNVEYDRGMDQTDYEEMRMWSTFDLKKRQEDLYLWRV
jgi:hypothetical protein